MRRQFQGNRLDHQQPHPPPGPPLMKTLGPPRAGGDQKQDVATSKDSAAAKLKALMKMTSLLSPVSKTSTQHPAIHPPWSKARVVPIEDVGGRLPGREGDVGLGKGQAVKMDNKKGGQVEAPETMGDREGSRELEIQLRDNRGSMTNNRMRNAAVEGGSRPEHGAQLPGFSSSVGSFSSDGSLLIDGIYFTEASQRPPMKQKPGKSLGLISLARRLQGPARVGDEQWSDGRNMYASIGEMSVSASVSSRRHKGGRWEKRDSETEQSDSETSSGSEESLSESSLTSTVTTKTEISESGSERDNWSQQGEEDVSDSEEESGSESGDDKTESSTKHCRGRGYESGSRNWIDRNRSTKDSDKHRHGSSNSNSSRYSSSKVDSSRPKTSRRSLSSHKSSEQENEESSDREEERKRVKSRKSSVSRRAHGHTHPEISSGVMDASDLWPIIEEQEKSSLHSEEGREEEEEEGVWGNESTA